MYIIIDAQGRQIVAPDRTIFDTIYEAWNYAGSWSNDGENDIETLQVFELVKPTNIHNFAESEDY